VLDFRISGIKNSTKMGKVPIPKLPKELIDGIWHFMSASLVLPHLGSDLLPEFVSSATEHRGLKAFEWYYALLEVKYEKRES